MRFCQLVQEVTTAARRRPFRSRLPFSPKSAPLVRGWSCCRLCPSKEVFMKKQTLKKLVLAKETVLELNAPTIKKALGGWDESAAWQCSTVGCN